MLLSDYKVYAISFLGLSLSLTDMEQILQVVLLVVSIIPATWKCLDFIIKKYKKINDDEKL